MPPNSDHLFQPTSCQYNTNESMFGSHSSQQANDSMFGSQAGATNSNDSFFKAETNSSTHHLFEPADATRNTNDSIFGQVPPGIGNFLILIK